MTWFDVMVYAMGWVLLTYFAWQVGKAIPRFAIAIARACSVCRWTFASGRVHGFHGLSRLAVFAWISLFFWSFVDGLDRHPPKYSCRHGVWTDIGNWTVFPSKVKP
jgi:hypothetical protein